MRGLSKGVDAAMDMPMNLLITAVITALTIPVFWSAYEDLSDRLVERSIMSEMDRVSRAVNDVMSGGVGSRIELTISIEGWGSSGVDRVEIGGPLEGGDSWESFVIRVYLSGGGDRILAAEPLYQMTSGEGVEGLALQTGEYDVIIVHSILKGRQVASLSLEGQESSILNPLRR